MKRNSSKERDDKRPPRNRLERTDRIKEERQRGRSQREQDDERDKAAPIPQDCRYGEQNDVALELKWNGPELRVDHAGRRIALKDARQGKVHEADDIAEVTAEFRTLQIAPERQGGEKRAKEQRGERDFDSESWDQPQRTKHDKLVCAGSLEAAGDEKPRQREEHGQNDCQEEAKRPTPRGAIERGRPCAQNAAMPNEHGKRQSNSKIVKPSRGAVPF